MTTLVKSNSNLIPKVPTFFDDLIIRDLFNWPILGHSGGDITPAVNIIETPGNYMLDVAVPGMKKEDFNIELDNDTLTISAETTQESEDTNQHYTRKEFNFRSFRRNFNLPEKLVEREKISAKYENGILHINIPKTERAKTHATKQIKIS